MASLVGTKTGAACIPVCFLSVDRICTMKNLPSLAKARSFYFWLKDFGVGGGFVDGGLISFRKEKIYQTVAELFNF